MGHPIVWYAYIVIENSNISEVDYWKLRARKYENEVVSMNE
jgi:hypothetical protein